MQVAAAERISKLVLPGNREGLEIVGLVVYVGIGSMSAVPNDDASSDPKAPGCMSVVQVIGNCDNAELVSVSENIAEENASEPASNTLQVTPCMA